MLKSSGRFGNETTILWISSSVGKSRFFFSPVRVNTTSNKHHQGHQGRNKEDAKSFERDILRETDDISFAKNGCM
tara:strand:- start:479 stop:703 length:225 start_codon:yes stop_codon:yes gene_type:complete